MRLVKVYGQLAQRLGQRVFKAAVDSPAEAVRFLCANFPGLDQWLIDSEQDGIAYRVKVSKTTVGEEDFGMFCDPDATISITPVLSGASGTAGQIFLGVGLIAASFLLPGAGLFGTQSVFGTLAAGTAGPWAAGVVGGAFATAAGTAFSAIGASLVLGGVAQMITPKPKPPGSIGGQSPLDNPSALQSYNFSGIQNTSTQGTPINVVYGKTFVGSVTLSAGIVNTSKK